ncbi:UNVERIFIED_CONTAM: Adenylate isopentenyltransferase [Sesamum radiatum]|uniref:Adenylate isopentenyltransferase n=1 Tax=Sesamum radiatum TaxID=300843 RepID=A0AAW2JQ81_SESRA
MASTTTTASASASARRHKKIVVIMGPTGCGKSKLSVDLASRFFPSSEIINSDKIQVYRGLDITTNKIPLPDRKNVPHHLSSERVRPQSESEDDVEKKMAYEEAVRAIKDNTCQLAKRQLGKILRLREAAGWELKRVEATESLRAAMGGGGG